MRCTTTAILFLISLLTYAHPKEVSLYRRKEQVRVKARYQRYILRSLPVLIGSERIWIDTPQGRGMLRRNRDYMIDYDTGEILFLMPVEGEMTATVEYETLPFKLRTIYSLDIFRSKGEITKVEPESPPRPEETRPFVMKPEGGLEVSGTKTLGISFGTGRSLTPTQSLRVNVSGNVGPDIQVTAMLTDQDLPIQPEGTSEEIQDLDRVLISIVGPFFSATLGDYQAGFEGSELVFTPKWLQGAQLKLNRGGYQLTMLGAASRGKSGSMTIRGVEGRNHYRISADGRYVVVIAGSETVWLNGRRMRRGEENDYVIRDYGDPVIEFTPRHLITSNDVIRVDFEYIDEESPYKQEVYGLGGRMNLSNGFIQADYALQFDDKSNPFEPLPKEDLELLRRDIRVNGEGRELVPPARHSVWGMSAGGDWIGGTSFDLEMALSSLDDNTFSALNPIRRGMAWRGALSSDRERFKLNLSARRIDADFFQIGATPQSRLRSEYESEYQTERFSDVLIGGIWKPSVPPTEGRYELQLSVTPIRSLQMETELSRSMEDYPDDLDMDSNRITWVQSLRYSHPSLINLDFEHIYGRSDKMGRPDYLDRSDRLSLSRSIGPARTEVRWRRTEVKDLNPEEGFDRSRRRSQLGGEISLLEGRSISFRTKLDLEEIEGRNDGGWMRESSARTASLEMNARGRSLDLRGIISRRRLSSISSGATTVNLADISLRMAPFDRILSLDIGYRIDRRLAPRRQEIFVKVPKGQGNYVKIDEYHYREDYIDGEYIKLIRTVGDFPVASVEASMRGRVQPRGKLRWLTVEVSSNVVEEQEAGDLAKLYTLRSLRTERTVYGRAVNRVRLELMPSERMRFGVRWSATDSLNRRTNERSRSLRIRSWRFSGDQRISKRLSIFQEMEISKSSERIVDSGQIAARIEERELTAAVGIRHRMSGSFYWETKLQHDDNSGLDRVIASSKTRARMTSMIWSVNYSLAGRGRFMVSYRLGFGRVRGEMPLTTYNLYDGLSHEVRVSADYQAYKVTDVLLRFNYRFLSAEGRPAEHRAEMEAVAEL
ncbi:hypothetical protein J7M22_02835, partial [Candidatus Poribacteria bacterium]|nr:hypothetical protein [Candidatus Poribacteria bacterium]